MDGDGNIPDSIIESTVRKWLKGNYRDVYPTPTMIYNALLRIKTGSQRNRQSEVGRDKRRSPGKVTLLRLCSDPAPIVSELPKSAGYITGMSERHTRGSAHGSFE